MAEIAILDDEKVLVDSLEIEMTSMGHKVKTFYEAYPFLDYIQSSEPELVLLDLQLPDIHGLEVLHKIRQTLKHTQTIIITAHGNMESAIQALKGGAFDYINKPFDLDELNVIVNNALDKTKLVREVTHYRESISNNTSIDDFIGTSEPVKKLKQMVKMLTNVDNTTILLRGASGTGKNILAKSIHNSSTRSGRQFIEVNCGAIPENLLESELFGHEKGAFTDARKQKIGLAEIASGGTLFLDEVGDLPLPLQVKLLQFLESKSFRRLGSTTEVKVDVLIIAATNRNLENAVEQKRFRADLYYRLNVVPVIIPSLKVRGQDIISLANYYLERFSQKFQRHVVILGEDARKIFLQYPWPGNVRELKNLIERLVILSTHSTISCEDLPEQMKEHPNEFHPDMAYDETIKTMERRLIDDALKKTGGVKSKAAQLLGMSRYSLLRKLKRL